MIQSFCITSVPNGDRFEFEIELFFQDSDSESSTMNSEIRFSTSADAIAAGLDQAHRTIAVSQLGDLLGEWSDNGLITRAEEISAWDTATS